MKLISERVSEALVRAAGHHDALIHHTTSSVDGNHRPRQFSIAISRETGTRGPAVARAVGKLLGWPVYDHELLEIVARELRVAVKLLESVDEHHVTWLQECVEAFAAVPAVREQKYVQHLVEAMLSLAVGGRCVIVGRGSPFVLPPATTLRVRLSAPVADRLAIVCHERSLSRPEAARHIARTDRDRAQFVKLHFLRDSRDVRHYDLFLNTSQFSIDECAHLIVNGLLQKSHADAQTKTMAAAGQLQFAS
ncbi:MAG TPA: cytidylate kinase-like family protein [Planctomycetaceae bacterium]|jgi:cytidylate kinase